MNLLHLQNSTLDSPGRSNPNSARSNDSPRLEEDINISPRDMLFMRKFTKTRLCEVNQYSSDSEIYVVKESHYRGLEHEYLVAKRIEEITEISSFFVKAKSFFIENQEDDDKIGSDTIGIETSVSISTDPSDSRKTHMNHQDPSDLRKKSYILLMERCRGRHWKDYYSDFIEGKCSMKILMIILQQILLMLYHIQNVIKFTHYDLHGKNIIIEEDVPKILSFRYQTGDGVLVENEFKTPFTIRFIDYGMTFVEGCPPSWISLGTYAIYNGVWPDCYDDIYDIIMVLTEHYSMLRIPMPASLVMLIESGGFLAYRGEQKIEKFDGTYLGRCPLQELYPILSNISIFKYDFFSGMYEDSNLYGGYSIKKLIKKFLTEFSSDVGIRIINPHPIGFFSNNDEDKKFQIKLDLDTVKMPLKREICVAYSSIRDKNDHYKQILDDYRKNASKIIFNYKILHIKIRNSLLGQDIHKALERIFYL